MLAVTTCHMVASFIFLNMNITFWTLLGLLAKILLVQTALDDLPCPFLNVLTSYWSVAQLMAVDAHFAGTRLVTHCHGFSISRDLYE